MDERKLELFRDALGAAATVLRAAPCREVTVVHHNDTDGIASGAILRAALMRAGFAVEHLPIERVHPAFLPAIHTPDRRLVLYADLGGQAAEVIDRHVPEGSRAIILDHHLPAPGVFPRVLQVNPERFGIDGDGQCAAAGVACGFAQALDERNEDLAALAVLGAVGDHQLEQGRCEGFNALLLAKAVERGDLRPGDPGEAVPWVVPRFQGRSLREVDRLVIALAVNGYYRRGADLAIAACLEGPDERTLAFSAETAALQRQRFAAEMDRIRREGPGWEGAIVWTDAADRLYPLGLKAIGLLCEEMIQEGLAEEERYVVGFQRFPQENPYLGAFSGDEAKVSFRVTPALRRAIESGRRPDLMQLVPPAVQQVGGFAEACHRFMAAATVPATRTAELVALLAARAAA